MTTNEAVHACTLCPTRMSCPHATRNGRVEMPVKLRLCRRGEMVFRAGEQPASLFVIRSGTIKVSRIWACGQEHVIRLLHPPEILGYRPLLTGEPYLGSAQALEDSTLCVFPGPIVLETIRSSPDLAFELLLQLARDSRRSETLIMDLVHGPAQVRAARLLVRFLDRSRGQAGPGGVRLRCPKHNEMARMIHTTPETFSRVLHRFEQSGMISLSRDDIRILDVDLLRKVSEEHCSDWN